MHSFCIKVNKIVLYLFPLITYWGYSCIFTDIKVWKMLQFVLIPLIFFNAVNVFLKRNKSVITKKVMLIFFLALLSIIMSFLIWNQNVILGYRVTAPFLSLVFYFFLVKNDFTDQEIERLIVFYGVVWIFVWLVNMLSPVPIFGLLDIEDINDSRGIIRFMIQGDGFLYLLFFLMFNKWLQQRKKIYLYFCVCVFVIIVLQVTRQTIASCCLIVLYYLLKNRRCLFWCLCSLAIVWTFADINLPKNSVFGHMTELTRNQYEENFSKKTNVRLEAYDYFFTKYSPNTWAEIFGNGLPHDDSVYGQMYTRLRFTRRIFYSDVGYAGIYLMMGACGLIAFAGLFYTVVKTPVVDARRLYAKMFVVYLFVCNFVSFVILSCIVPMTVALYMLNKECKQSKRIR